MITRPEVLAPAGDMECLNSALSLVQTQYSSQAKCLVCALHQRILTIHS